MKITEIKSVTFDIESEGLDWVNDKLLLIGYRYNSSGPVFQLDNTLGEDDELFRQVLADSRITKRGHNIKFDTLFLLRNGYSVSGTYDDTSILCYLEDPFRPNGLKDLVETKLGKNVCRLGDLAFKPLKKERPILETFYIDYYFIIDGWWYRKDKLKEYNKNDVINCDDLRKEVIANDWYTKVEQPLISFFIDTEFRGIQLSEPILQDLFKELDKTLGELEKEIGVENCNSSAQISSKLRELGTNLVVKTATGKDKTDKLVLKQLSWGGNALATTILRYRELSKLHTTYVMPLLSKSDALGRLHGSFNQAGHNKDDGSYANAPKTGRLSSSNPNLQNIPDRTEEGRKIRKAFIPTSGYLMFDSDLKRIEPKIIAHFSQSKKLLELNKSGVDTHAMFASDIFRKPVLELKPIERFIGKTSWLASTYGCQPKKLKEICERQSPDPIYLTESYFAEIQENFWAANPELSSWRTQLIAETRNLGYITTIGGRRIKIPGLRPWPKSEWARAEVERVIVNYKIQGSAADVMKLVLIRFQNEFVKTGLGHILATIHDEVLGEYKDEGKYDIISIVNNIMTSTVKLNNVPIEADTKIIKDWSEK